jgi:penicillin-binding protein-related factor A (putative recombinase)
MTPEGRVKEKVKAMLRYYGAYYHMPVQNGMGKSTLDFIGCFKGRFFAVETKAGEGTYTARQEITRDEIEKAEGEVFLVNSHSGLEDLELWIKSTINGAYT